METEQDRNQAEEVLWDPELGVHSIMEAASDAIVVARCNGEIIYANRAAEAAFGYSREDLLGKPLSVLMPERYREARQRGLRRVEQTGKSQLQGKLLELHGLRKDRTEFPIELSLAVWKSGPKQYCGGIIRDITERKQAEEALRTVHAELERRVAERTAELAKANAALQEKIEDLEKFHEVVVGRELKMMQLEKEVRLLQQENDLLRGKP